MAFPQLIIQVCDTQFHFFSHMLNDSVNNCIHSEILAFLHSTAHTLVIELSVESVYVVSQHFFLYIQKQLQCCWWFSTVHMNQ